MICDIPLPKNMWLWYQ